MKKTLAVLCAAVILAAFCFNAISITQAQSNEGKAEDAKAITTTQDKLAAAVSVIYKRAGDVVLSLPYASINLSQTALMKVYSGEQNDALLYLNTHSDKELNNAYAAMDEILKEFDAVLTKYSVSSTSSYRQKRAELASTFAGLKTSTTELIRRTRTLIAGTNSSYDSYYTSYCDQLIVVSDTFEAATTKIGKEYDTLMTSLLGNDYSIVS